ncbi:AbrB/MazE/SpoVT family DNA-binding domain-containing protein [Neptuniibacter sp. QD37_11]|uniref:AbrB/MazE/SpoVT family DNA-binding domain-containing protein n=1 Tax=Neptuniibacter sp. QD37_11 TaxID=3398209 RepID=UPI0039F571A3
MKLGPNNEIRLPDDVCKRLGVSEGDDLGLYALDDKTLRVIVMQRGAAKGILSDYADALKVDGKRPEDLN